MLVSDFDYDLPQELIAQTPLEPRDHSRLLVLDRATKSLADHHFFELPKFLRPGDLLIFNDTKVIPARLAAQKAGSQGAKLEVFLLKELGLNQWECLMRPGKRVRVGTKIEFASGLTAEVLTIDEAGNRIIQFPLDCNFRAWLALHGETPLPPYITAKLHDPERYQTIYAKHEGSVAVPTAGLHFTPELLEKLQHQGVKTGFLTLQVGLGTFRPVKTELLEEHVMHTESFVLSEALIEEIRQIKASGGRVIAVGTTVVRVLESQVDAEGNLKAGSGETAIFIYPGYQFKVVDALITNFHLPKSTLLMLVSALAGCEITLAAYQHAVKTKYRFFSFGDAVFIK